MTIYAIYITSAIYLIFKRSRLVAIVTTYAIDITRAIYLIFKRSKICTEICRQLQFNTIKVTINSKYAPPLFLSIAAQESLHQQV